MLLAGQREQELELIDHGRLALAEEVCQHLQADAMSLPISSVRS
jgi:hypothetical protein